MIDGHKLKKFILAGAGRLNKNREKVDALNVFPVPDGDTGTNMSLTVLSAAKEVSKVNSPNIHDVAKALSSGSLKGARGNSGVILSQLFRGFSKSLEGKDIANVKDIANAFQKGMETAYKAVMKPKEGTILTVSKGLSEKAMEMASKTDDIMEMMKEVVKYGNTVLDKTINMLPELKQAGVVDAGGKGLLSILEGGLFDKGEYIQLDIVAKEQIDIPKEIPKNIENVDIKYGYCTEFFINTEKQNDLIEEQLKIFLENIGDSIVIASDDDFIKIHVHTDNPGAVLERALKIGSLDNIKIENMRIQHTHLIDFNVQKETNQNLEEKKEEKEQKEYGFVAVSIGEGLNDMFKEFGVDYIIEGGQTMNPSTEDILNAIEKVNAKNVFVLPNNKNIILAAKQAKDICETKNVIVIETINIPQGYTTLMNFLETRTLEENIENMTKSISNISTGQITFAVRETKIEEFEIKENDFLCIFEGDICAISKQLENSAKVLADKMIEANEDASVITIYYGEDVSEEDANEIAKYVEEKYSYLDIEVIYGGQPLYYYIMSVE
ncbi:MAG: DAK2 domain-containing protein [Eubacteriales bacterium]|nr:DAK2 domain-containing protein [Eubacteriales bacterium]